MLRRCVLGGLALLPLACGHDGPPPKNVPPILANADAGKDQQGAGSHWVLDFNESSLAIRIALDGGATLIIGDGGERWIAKEGSFESAQTILPEPIATAKKTNDGFRMVGKKTGAVYTSKDPLGPVTKVSKGMEDAQILAVGKDATIAVTKKGEVLRSTDGEKWSKVAIPETGVPVKLAMHGAEGLLVTVPQHLYGTKDDGATWTPVKTPAIRLRYLNVGDDGIQIVGETYSDRYRFDAAWGTFTRATTTRRTTSESSFSSDLERRVRVIDGSRALEIYIDDSGSNRVWTIATGTMSGQLSRRVVPELGKCDGVNGDIMGDTIVLTCDMEGAVPNAKGPTSGWITKVFRSEDGGKNFKLETTLDGGHTDSDNDVPVAIGSGGMVYLGRRCPEDGDCNPARFRASSDAAWKPIGVEKAESEDEDDMITRHVAFTRSGGALYSIGIRDREAKIYAWKGTGPDGQVSVGFDVDTADLASLSADTDGTFRGYVRDGSKANRTFEWKQGMGSPKTFEMPEESLAVFAGKKGFAIGDSGHETSDGGRTWSTFPAPSSVTQVVACSDDGCATDGGYRLGWSGPTKTTETAKEPPKPTYARPLRCSASGSWSSIGRGILPNVHAAAHGTSRWAVPVRLDKKVALVSNKRGEPITKTTTTTLFEAPPTTASTSSVRTYVQRNGFVAVRYVAQSAPTEKIVNIGGKLRIIKAQAPFDVSLAWVRDANLAKVMKGTIPALTMSANTIKDGDYDDDTKPEVPELVTLGAAGLAFHPPLRDDATTIPQYLVKDDGKSETSTFNVGREAGIAWTFGDLGVVGTSARTGVAAGDGTWTAVSNDGRRTPWSATAGLYSSDASVSVFEWNSKPAFAITLRGPDYPARAWVIPVTMDTNLGAGSPLPTQKSLGDVPKACDAGALADAKASDFVAPWVNGARRPIVIDLDGIAQVLASDGEKVRISNGSECVLALDGKNATYSVIVYPEDPSQSILFRRNASSIDARPLDCSFVQGPLPPELAGQQGFVAETH